MNVAIWHQFEDEELALLNKGFEWLKKCPFVISFKGSIVNGSDFFLSYMWTPSG